LLEAASFFSGFDVDALLHLHTDSVFTVESFDFWEKERVVDVHSFEFLDFEFF
jgi:hypothetical protein